jgi:hypothetical protein
VHVACVTMLKPSETIVPPQSLRTENKLPVMRSALFAMMLLSKLSVAESG